MMMGLKNEIGWNNIGPESFCRIFPFYLVFIGKACIVHFNSLKEKKRGDGNDLMRPEKNETRQHSLRREAKAVREYCNNKLKKTIPFRSLPTSAITHTNTIPDYIQQGKIYLEECVCAISISVFPHYFLPFSCKMYSMCPPHILLIMVQRHG